MSDRFNLIVNSYKDKLDLLKLSDTKKYILELNNFYKNILLLEKDSLNSYLEKIGILEEFKKFKKYSQDLMGEIHYLKIDPESKTITIKNNELTIKEELVDITKYLKDKNLKEDSWEYYLLLSFLIYPDNYELYQVYHAIILK